MILFKNIIKISKNNLVPSISIKQSQNNLFIYQTRCNFTLALINQNPFQSMTPQQLKYYYINNQNPQSLNTLILLGSAMKKNKMKQLSLLLLNSKKILSLQIQLNNQNPQQIAYGKFINLFMQKKKIGQKLQQPPKQILEAYINCYCYITSSIQQHLLIYESLSKYKNKKISQNLRIAKSISEQKILQFFSQKQIGKNFNKFTLSDFILYCRNFPALFNNYPNFFLNILQGKSRQISDLSRRQKIILSYILSSISIKSQFLQKYGFKQAPNLNSNLDSAKQVCMKFQIWKHSYEIKSDQMIQKYIKQGHLEQQIYQWDYNQLIWLSDFLPKQGSKLFNDKIIFEKIHNALIKKQIDQIDHIINYISNQKQYFHQSLSQWLASQDFSQQNQKHICDVLIYIGKYGQKFLKFHSKIVSQALGKYQWQNLNIIYYFGILWKSQDQNLEYIRRYILNQYIAKGTQRRQIPTSSYFYKILQITDVQKFYANYFKMN